MYTERASAYLLWPVSKWKERKKTVLLEPPAREGRNESHQACADSWSGHQSFHTKAPAHPTARELEASRCSGTTPGRDFYSSGSSLPLGRVWCLGKESACNTGDQGLIFGLGRSPGGGNGHPLEYSCLENSMDRGAWWATVRSVSKSRTQLSD